MADQGIHSPGGFWVGKFQWVFLRKASICFLILPNRFDVSKYSEKGKFLTSRHMLIAHVYFSAQLFFSIKESWPVLDNCQIFYIFSGCFLAVLNFFYKRKDIKKI